MMAKRMALEIGMGTDIRGGDSTTAAARALTNALWRNALTIARALGKSEDAIKANLYRMRRALAESAPGIESLIAS